MRITALSFAILATLATGATADGHRSAAPDEASVYIVSPENGATVSSPVTVVFGLRGMGVAPAGTEADMTGHHHLLIDTALEDVQLDEPLPATDTIRHFGGGQTEAEIELDPGSHTLRLLLGDWSHVPHDPPVMSEEINITVE